MNTKHIMAFDKNGMLLFASQTISTTSPSAYRTFFEDAEKWINETFSSRLYNVVRGEGPIDVEIISRTAPSFITIVIGEKKVGEISPARGVEGEVMRVEYGTN